MLAIYALADALAVPIFSASSLRFSLPALQAAARGDYGTIVGRGAFFCVASSPSSQRAKNGSA